MGCATGTSTLGGWTALSLAGGRLEDWLRGVVEERRKVRVPLAERPSLRDLKIKVSHEDNVYEYDTAAFGGTSRGAASLSGCPRPKKKDDSRSVA